MPGGYFNSPWQLRLIKTVINIKFIIYNNGFLGIREKVLGRGTQALENGGSGVFFLNCLMALLMFIPP